MNLFSFARARRTSVASLALLVLASTASAADPAKAQAKDAPALTPVHPAQLPQSQAEAQRLSDAFVSVANQVTDSVVQIDVVAREESADPATRWVSRGGLDVQALAHETGSGVIYSAEGAILTNNHVIEQALNIWVRLHDGRQLPAKLVGRDPDTDLAVIKVDATGLVPAKFADSDAARVGEWVVAIGSPFGLGYSVTAGVLSAKGRSSLGGGGAGGASEIEDYLQTDASINPGNSGGPLCDLNGKVLGINTMILARAGGSIGIGFAVPSNMAGRVADQILKSGHVSRPAIGLQTQDLTPDLASMLKVESRSGALVAHVEDNGPAAHANVRPGDVIASAGGHAVHDGVDLLREVLAHDIGQPLSLEIVRDGKHYKADVTLAARTEQAIPPIPAQTVIAPQAGLGIRIRDVSASEAASSGFPSQPMTVITFVDPGSPAERAGLKKGDVIVQADGQATPTSDQVVKAATDGSLLLRVRRRDRELYAALHK